MSAWGHRAGWIPRYGQGRTRDRAASRIEGGGGGFAIFAGRRLRANGGSRRTSPSHSRNAEYRQAGSNAPYREISVAGVEPCAKSVAAEKPNEPTLNAHARGRQ